MHNHIFPQTHANTNKKFVYIHLYKFVCVKKSFRLTIVFLHFSAIRLFFVPYLLAVFLVPWITLLWSCSCQLRVRQANQPSNHPAIVFCWLFSLIFLKYGHYFIRLLLLLLIFLITHHIHCGSLPLLDDASSTCIYLGHLSRDHSLWL